MQRGYFFFLTNVVMFLLLQHTHNPKLMITVQYTFFLNPACLLVKHLSKSFLPFTQVYISRKSTSQSHPEDSAVSLAFVRLCHHKTGTSMASESKTRNVSLTLMKNELKDKIWIFRDERAIYQSASLTDP